MLRHVALFGIFAIGACATVPPQVGAEKLLADAVHAYAVGQDVYRTEASVKAMAACIDWPETIDQPVKVAFTPWTYVSIGSDGSIATGPLAQDALERCEGAAASERLSCKCQIVDRNNRADVSVPERLRPALAAAPASYVPPTPRGPDNQTSDYSPAGVSPEAVKAFDTCASSKVRAATAITACTTFLEDPGGSAEDRANAFANRSYEYRALKNYDAALADDFAAIESDPTLARSYNGRGLTYLERSEYDLALADFNQALALEPEFALAMVNLGNTYRASGKPDRARIAYDRSIETDPDDGRVYHMRGRLAMNLENFAAAEQDFTAAIQRKRNPVDPLNERAYARIALGNLDGALADVTEAVRKKPDSYYVLDTLGDVHCRRGDSDAALSAWQRSRDADPKIGRSKRRDLEVLGFDITDPGDGFGPSTETVLTAWAKGGCKRLCTAHIISGQPVGKDGEPADAAACLTRLDNA